jgi:hypothetical protein
MTHNRRITSAGIHLLASACVAAVAAAVVFFVWYPTPHAALAGGLSLFGLLVGVDLALGPVLTAVVASPNKPSAEFRRDLAVIVLVQLSAFGYGVYSIAAARPVHMVFEVDRFRVVSVPEIDTASLHDAPPGLQSLPWSGPTLIAAVKPAKADDQLRSMVLSLAGVQLSMVPRNWRDYATHADEVWAAARPVKALTDKYPASAPDVAKIAASAGQTPDALRFLPLQSRQLVWVVLLAAPGARPVGYLPLNGLF